MNDKQTTSLILLVIFAFVFWLYNTNRLSSISKVISEPQNAGGFDFGSTTGSVGNSNQQVAPVILVPPTNRSGSQTITPLPALKGVPTMSTPYGYNDLPTDQTGLQQPNRTNAIADYSSPVISFFNLPETALISGVEGILS